MFSGITTSTLSFAAQDEPTTGSYIMTGKDILGHTTTVTGMIEWVNTGPVVVGQIISGYIYNTFTFSTNAIDTGSS